MTIKQQDMAKRMAAAAASRAGGTKPSGTTAIRTKPIRITLDLSKADYDALNRWLAATGVELGHAVSKNQALRAMIHAAAADDVVNGVVVDQLRREQAA